jgi:hypothetical protein
MEGDAATALGFPQPASSSRLQGYYSSSTGSLSSTQHAAASCLAVLAVIELAVSSHHQLINY